MAGLIWCARRKLVSILAVVFVSLCMTLFVGIPTSTAHAQIPCYTSLPNQYPNQLTNGTTADATKVMENFNYIRDCPIFKAGMGVGMLPVNGYAFSSSNVRTSYLYNMGAYCWYDYPNCTHPYGVYLAGQAYYSDSRLKQNIRTLDESLGLEAIMKLRPVSFTWRDKARNDLEGSQNGFIAQEVAVALPTASVRFPRLADGAPDAVEVRTADGRIDTINSPMRINPDKFIPVLVKAMQQLKAENDNQAKELATLKADVARLLAAQRQ